MSNSACPKKKKREENILFFKRLVKNPRSLGAIVPSSEALGKFIAEQIDVAGSSPLVEIGAGTGSLTQALLRAGVPPSRLYVVELDRALSAYLKSTLPSHVHLITGDACELQNLLPPSIIGNVSTVISGIPMMNLSLETQMALTHSCLSVLKPEGRILQFTYGPISPLPAKKLGLDKKKLGHVFLNFPPATIWQYRQKL